ncbi:MAG: hypothetical protein ACYC99_07550 [Candidatus Geothermincolia bacterium]
MNDVIENLAVTDTRPPCLIPGFTKLIVLRPLFMSAGQIALQRAASEAIVSAHRKVIHAALEDDALKARHFSSFFEWTEQVLGLDRPGPVHATCLRLDGSIVDGRPVFFELNADMPQGIGLVDSCARFIAELPFVEEFDLDHPSKPMLLQEQFLQALLSEWESWGGKGSPRICFATWRDEPVRRTDMILNCEYLASRGFDAVVADPRELDFNGGSLSIDGRIIDLVYRVASTAETLDKPDEMDALVRAEKAGAVLMINSFRSELLGHKAMFALLQDEMLQGMLTPDEKTAVRNCIPWTRIMCDGLCKDFSGAEIDLVNWVLDRREELVLKPTHDFGGHGVTLGSCSDQSEWESAVLTALEHDFIVQRKIGLGRSGYPVAEKGIPIYEFYEDVDPLMLGNRFAGCITRLSADEITNVHLHGAIGATFELERDRL